LFEDGTQKEDRDDALKAVVLRAYVVHADRRYYRNATSREPSPAQALSAQNTLSPRITSPVLSALGTSPFNKIGFDTTAWANDIPFARSPPPNGNTPPLSGTPPAALPPSESVRGGFSNASPPMSPRPAYRIPVRNNGYQNFGDPLGTSPRARPVSFPGHSLGTPPLPHHNQAHFYGVDERTVGEFEARSSSRYSKVQGLRSFDCLPAEGAMANILFTSFENGLLIHKFDKSKLETIGGISDLRGEVLKAKFLPEDYNPVTGPLLILIVHGPMSVEEEHGFKVPVEHGDEFDPSASMAQALYSMAPPAQPSMYYQTTVEIYSCKTSQLVATLFKSQPLQRDVRYGTRSSVPPSPWGNLEIHASGRFIVLTSGISGEVYMFEFKKSTKQFNCLGKAWTSVPTRRSRTYSTSSNSSGAESMGEAPNDQPNQPDRALVALKNRLLVIVPPPASSRTTLQGTIGLPITAKPPPGLTSHTSPAQPTVTCVTDTPLEEPMLNKITRDVTQEVMKGAQYVASKGLNMWQNYWNKPADPASNYNPDVTAFQTQQKAYFPPTHGPDDDKVAARKKPTVVSMIDLERLSASQEKKPGSHFYPIATFSLPMGCSFVSLNTSGLSLFTASTKGDVQCVWDLMCMVKGMANSMATGKDAPFDKPFVRQIARFTRMTVAVIVDVIWTAPIAEKLAIVTDRGTVHLFDMPKDAYNWPPRRPTRPGITAVKSSDAQPVSALSSAFSMVSNTAGPLVSTIRKNPPNISNAISGISSNLSLATVGAGARGTRQIATGISKSVGAAASGTVNSLRYRGENLVKVPSSSTPVGPGCARWIESKDRTFLAVLGGDTMRVYALRKSTNPDAVGAKSQTVIGAMLREFALPKTKTVLSSPGVNPDHTKIPGWWKMYPAQPSVKIPTARLQALAVAEVDSCATVLPFYEYRNVEVDTFVATEEMKSRASGYKVDGLTRAQSKAKFKGKKWVFGEEILAGGTGYIHAKTKDVEAWTETSATAMEATIIAAQPGEEVTKAANQTDAADCPKTNHKAEPIEVDAPFENIPVGPFIGAGDIDDHITHEAEPVSALDDWLGNPAEPMEEQPPLDTTVDDWMLDAETVSKASEPVEEQPVLEPTFDPWVPKTVSKKGKKKKGAKKTFDDMLGETAEEGPVAAAATKDAKEDDWAKDWS
jgi:hypothetical protein